MLQERAKELGLKNARFKTWKFLCFSALFAAFTPLGTAGGSKYQEHVYVFKVIDHVTNYINSGSAILLRGQLVLELKTLLRWNVFKKRKEVQTLSFPSSLDYDELLTENIF